MNTLLYHHAPVDAVVGLQVALARVELGAREESKEITGGACEDKEEEHVEHREVDTPQLGESVDFVPHACDLPVEDLGEDQEELVEIYPTATVFVRLRGIITKCQRVKRFVLYAKYSMFIQ